jgi:Fic family protein
MATLVDWTKNSFKENKIHPLIIIANFIFEFLAIHPFQD